MYSAVYWHESNTQFRNFITFLKLKTIIFGKTNNLVIYLKQNYEFSYKFFNQLTSIFFHISGEPTTVSIPDMRKSNPVFNYQI
jgi:hypothetical protein